MTEATMEAKMDQSGRVAATSVADAEGVIPVRRKGL
jgi:hypothetical protein